jgi:hypothetical protein
MLNKPVLKKAIFDAGPLLLVLAINYSIQKHLHEKENFIKKAYSDLDKFPNPVYNLNEFFNGFNIIYTTPHVIGEVIG